MAQEFDAAVALAGFTTPDGKQLTPDTMARVDGAIDLVLSGRSVNLIVTGAFALDVPSQNWHLPQAYLMREHAIHRGVPEESIFCEVKAIDTIGNALFTKVDITEPRGWRRLALFTSFKHIKRSLPTFRHVMGPSYSIEGMGTPQQENSRIQRLHEAAGSIILWTIMNNTEPGDDAVIQKALFEIIPKYTDLSKPVVDFKKLAFGMIRAARS